jgi:hypothetical protein
MEYKPMDPTPLSGADAAHERKPEPLGEDYRPMDPTTMSGLDLAHDRIENLLGDLVDEFGEDETTEALVGVLIISRHFNSTEIRRKLEAHDELDQEFEPDELGGNHAGDDWDENIRSVERELSLMQISDDLGGRFDD